MFVHSDDAVDPYNTRYHLLLGIKMKYDIFMQNFSQFLLFKWVL